jgi:signal transduction histidine kinase
MNLPSGKTVAIARGGPGGGPSSSSPGVDARALRRSEVTMKADEEALRRNHSHAGLSDTARDPRQPNPLSALGRLAGRISHDLRLPLTSILAYAELLAASGLDEMQRRDLYQEISLAVDRMIDMISLLLEFSRGSERLQPVLGNIRETVDRAIRTITVRPEFRRLTVRYLHEGLTEAWFDPKRLERVITNIVVNACEAVSPDNGRVEVTSVGRHDRVEIYVRDNGPGIPEPIRDSLFQPFVTYGKEGGTGLGLAIARKMLQDHGGELDLSRTDGTGTLFRIVLPSVPSGREAPCVEHRPSSSSRIPPRFQVARDRGAENPLRP